MKCLPSFFIGILVGTAIGAIVALLFAPLSGDELRSRIGQEAQAERQKVQAGYEKTKHQTQERIGKLQHRQLAESGQNDVAEAAVED
ncbi:MAG: YtxH domain-containing protein [Candidatus Promineifilaceae bacterium]